VNPDIGLHALIATQEARDGSRGKPPMVRISTVF
jgi:hypothetical protein